MKLPYILISLIGGAIIPLQLAMVNAFRQSTHASQIQATFYLYLGGMVASALLAFVMSGTLRPPMPTQASWWMWLFGLLGSFYILFMFIAAPKSAQRIHCFGCFWDRCYSPPCLRILVGWVLKYAELMRLSLQDWH